MDNPNDSEVIKKYLEQIENSTFLSKKEEIKIGERIKEVEQRILEECMKSPIFLRELKRVCESVERNNTNAIKYSKNLIEDSPKDDKIRVCSHFIDALKILNQEDIANNDHELLCKFVFYINFTSSAINQMIMPIKQQYTKVKSLQQQTDSTYKFLEIDTKKQYDELVNSCQDAAFLNNLARKLYTSSDNLVKRLQQEEEVIKYKNENDLDPKSIFELNKLIEAIRDLEDESKKDREKLIRANLPLVVSRAKRFNHSDMDLEDLIQEGNIGLIKAIDKYEPARNVKITTYATWWIDQAIRRSISNKSKVVRVPIHVQQRLKKINQAFFILSQRLKREPTMAEIAEYTGIKLRPDEGEDSNNPNTIEGLSTTALHECGMENEVSQGLNYADILQDKSSPSPVAEAALNMLKSRVRLAITELSPRDQKIIRLRFGIGEPGEHTLEEIGTKFSVTKERIRQLEAKSLKKLKANNSLKGAKDD